MINFLTNNSIKSAWRFRGWYCICIWNQLLRLIRACSAYSHTQILTKVNWLVKLRFDNPYLPLLSILLRHTKCLEAGLDRLRSVCSNSNRKGEVRDNGSFLREKKPQVQNRTTVTVWPIWREGHGNEVCVHNPIWDENYIFKKNVNTITVPHSRVCMCDNQRHNRIWLLSNRSQTIPAVPDWNSILLVRIVYCPLFTVLETKNVTASIRSKHKQLIIVQTKFRSSNQAKLENCQIGYSMWKWRVAVNGGPQVSGYNCSASIFSPFCFHYFLGFVLLLSCREMSVYGTEPNPEKRALDSWVWLQLT